MHPRHIRRTTLALLTLVAIGSSAGFTTIQPETSPADPAKAAVGHSAVTPAPRADEWWPKRHEAMNARAAEGAAKGDIGIVFLGDSITEGWAGAGKKVWAEFYEKRHAVNFGIGGDRTQHVLWRIQHGNLDGLAKPKSGSAPKLVILMIGTNNSNRDDNTAAQIADGIKACVAAIREKLPESKVLLLSIFPRGEQPGAQRDKNAEASRLAAAVADGKTIYTLDLTDKFVGKDGTISKDIMPDYLHLSEQGYRIWAEAIETKVKELLGEK